MALIRWNPTSDLMNLHSEMDRIFNDVWQGFGLTPRGGDGQAAAGYLPLDLERTEDAVVAYAPVPGFTPEEVSVTVDSVRLPLVRRPEPKRIPVTVDEPTRIVDAPGEAASS